MKTIAIIGVAHGQKALYLKAKEMGVRTIGFGWQEGAECDKLADRYYPVSILDTDRICEICEAEGVDGVVSNASNLTARVTATISERMNLIGNPRTVIDNALDKWIVRNLTEDIHSLTPVRYELMSAGIRNTTLAYPCIVKPTGGGGKRGVSYVANEIEFNNAVKYACESGCGEVLIEEFITGNEISVESISYNGEHFVLQITDKENTGAPHFVEIAHHQPSQLPVEIQNRIKLIVPEILSKLGFRNGATHIEFKIDNSGNIYLIEVNPRGGGDEISNQLVYLSTGIDYLRLMISVALGRFDSTSLIFHPSCAGIYFLCNQTANLASFITDSDNQPWFHTKEINDKELMISTGNRDRNGWMIYQGPDKISPQKSV